MPTNALRILKYFSQYYTLVTMPLCLHKYPFNELALANVFVENVEYSNIDRYTCNIVLLQL